MNPFYHFGHFRKIEGVNGVSRLMVMWIAVKRGVGDHDGGVTGFPVVLVVGKVEAGY